MLLADASKFELEQSHVVAGLYQLDVVITEAVPKWLRKIKSVERV